MAWPPLIVALLLIGGLVSAALWLLSDVDAAPIGPPEIVSAEEPVKVETGPTRVHTPIESERLSDAPPEGPTLLVLGPDGNPVPRAEIELRSRSFWFSSSSLDRLQDQAFATSRLWTDSEGRLPLATHASSIRNATLHWKQLSGVLALVGNTLPTSVQLKPAARVSIRVLDAEDKPVKHHPLSIQAGRHELSLSEKPTTGASGCHRLEIDATWGAAFLTGSLSIAPAYTFGDSLAFRKVELRFGEEIGVDLRAPPSAALEFVLPDVDRDPPGKNASMRLTGSGDRRRWGGIGYEELPLGGEAAGRAHLASVRPGSEFNAVVCEDGRPDASMTVRVPETPGRHRITLPRSRRAVAVRLTVLDAESRPLAFEPLTFEAVTDNPFRAPLRPISGRSRNDFRQGEDKRKSPPHPRQLVTDRRGEGRLHAVPGESTRLRITRNRPSLAQTGLEARVVTVPDVGPDEVAEVVVSFPETRLLVEGELKMTENGVFRSWQGSSTVIRLMPVASKGEAFTIRPDQHFRFSACVAPGDSRRWFIWAEDRKGQSRVHVVQPTRLGLELAIRDPGSLRGRVRADGPRGLEGLVVEVLHENGDRLPRGRLRRDKGRPLVRLPRSGLFDIGSLPPGAVRLVVRRAEKVLVNLPEIEVPSGGTAKDSRLEAIWVNEPLPADGKDAPSGRR